PSASAPTPMSLGTIRDHIESLLDPATRRNFANTANHLIRLGLRNGKHLEPRRQKLRGIVEANRQIWRLYNEYASVHIVAEKRVTYRLPVFRDLVDEEEEDGDEMEIEEEEEDEGAESEATEQSQDPTDTPNSKMANIIPRPHTRANLMRQHNGTSELSAFETESANNQEEQTSDKENSIDPSPIINPTSPLPPHHRYIIPIINPEALPINRIQDIQALRYPSARIYAMLTHRNVNGDVIQVTADMDAGPVDHLLINDTRIITALELRQPDYDTISIQENILRINETFTIHISPSQRLRYSNDFLVGELRPARHAYLYWLDSRGSADPKCGPWAQEARRIAGKLGRRAPDVWREIEGYWSLEQGAGGKVYRTDRLRYLGEDPVYDE
ncbi:hypothetical protein CC86DRAFT_271037, partial [Ophiobolus disseminans]